MEDIVLDMTKVKEKCNYPTSTAYLRSSKKLTRQELLDIAEEVLLDNGCLYIPVIIDGKRTKGLYAKYVYEYSPEPFACHIVLSPKLLTLSNRTIKGILRHELRHHEDRLEAFGVKEEVNVEDEELAEAEQLNYIRNLCFAWGTSSSLS